MRRGGCRADGAAQSWRRCAGGRRGTVTCAQEGAAAPRTPSATASPSGRRHLEVGGSGRVAPRLRRPLRMRSGAATVCGAGLGRACPALPGVVVLRLLGAAALEGTF